MPVAVAIDAIAQDVIGQHLHLPDFPRPGALGARRVEIAPLLQRDRGHDLRAKQLGAAAVMRQRHQRVAGVEIALHRAEIGLKRPERQQDPARDAIVVFNPLKGGAVFLAVGRAIGDPVFAR